MLREKDKVFRNAMALCDAFIISLSFIFSFFLRLNFRDLYSLDLFPGANLIVDVSSLSISDYLIVLFFVVPIWSAALYLNDMYKSMRTKNIANVLWIVVKAAFFTVIVFGAAVFVFKLKFVSRAFFIMFMAISVSALIAEKIAIFAIAHYIRKKGYNYRRLIVVGTGRRASQFISKVRNHPEWGLKIVGLIDYDEGLNGKEFEGSKVIGTLDDLPNILHDHSIDEVVFIVPRAKLDSIQNSIYVCEIEGVRATIAADLFELKIARARQTDLEGMPLVTFETTVAEEWELFIKRAFDISASVLGIIVLSPIFLLTAILIKLSSPGPIFYVNKRIGLNGRKFVFYKFRSMYKGAHIKLSELMGKNEMKGPIFKIKNDPRITPLGKLMRKLSIDELPQLFNVLIGEMSLVGPRPPIPQEVARYEPWQRRRLSMRPGITCIWQVSGRSTIGFEEWMKMDLEYIDNWSLWLDVKILLKTIPAVMFGVGAY